MPGIVAEERDHNDFCIRSLRKLSSLPRCLRRLRPIRNYFTGLSLVLITPSSSLNHPTRRYASQQLTERGLFIERLHSQHIMKRESRWLNLSLFALIGCKSQRVQSWISNTSKWHSFAAIPGTKLLDSSDHGGLWDWLYATVLVEAPKAASAGLDVFEIPEQG